MTIALMLNSRLPLRSVLSGIMLLPWIVPEIVTALAWRASTIRCSADSIRSCRALGLSTIRSAGSPIRSMAMGSVISVNIWKGIPFYVLLLLAGLKAVDREQLEAAESMAPMRWSASAT